jgi:predicted phosphodiesterase
MKVFAVSDVHVDYDVNAAWVEGLSLVDHQRDVLILAGDISDSLPRLERCFDALARRFRQVLFVPGNHDLWVARDNAAPDSLRKFDQVAEAAARAGVSMQPFHHGALTIVPLQGWYDFSFGLPNDDLKRMWTDFRACRWPEGFDMARVADHFLEMNRYRRRDADETIISFSHFLPRIDLMPAGVPDWVAVLFPILGTQRLEPQIRALQPVVHVYGHSHLNRNLVVDGIRYINNAFAYPSETRIAAKALACIHEVPDA